MVKISELNNKQLLSQIAKYEKILMGLFKERQKRVKSGSVSAEQLMTPREKSEGKMATSTSDMTTTTTNTTNPAAEQAKAAPAEEKPAAKESAADAPRPFPMSGNEATEAGFKFDEDMLQEMQEANEDKDDEGTQTGVEEVQVTTLLQLSKEQLAELKSSPKKKKKK